MKLIYLSQENLNDRLFIKDFVHNFKLSGNTLLIHEPFNKSVKDSRFVTKRLSALLSETMVYNNAFSADQRNFFYYEDDQLRANISLMEELFQTVQLLILSPVVRRKDNLELLAPTDMIQTMRKQTEVDIVLTFTDNPLSPLASKGPVIEKEEDVEHWKKLYDEEQAALLRAFDLRPAKIVSPTNYST